MFGASSEWLVPAIYGDAYRPYVQLAPFVAAATVIYALDLVPTVRLRILRRTRTLFAARAGFAPLCLVLAWALPTIASTRGVGLAALSLAVVSTGGAWIALIRLGQPSHYVRRPAAR
jgi:O-antigen/teichoic acid export membrane protein